MSARGRVTLSHRQRQGKASLRLLSTAEGAFAARCRLPRDDSSDRKRAGQQPSAVSAATCTMNDTSQGRSPARQRNGKLLWNGKQGGEKPLVCLLYGAAPMMNPARRSVVAAVDSS